MTAKRKRKARKKAREVWLHFWKDRVAVCFDFKEWPVT
jgi:hypothetical protein